MFRPPVETPVAYRPLVNLSFAINYAIGAVDVFGYRLVNLALHLGCALLIFAVIRSRCALVLAGVVALLWTVHPLNSEVVDYVSERSDSMMALCYLAALYTSLRAHQSPRPLRWRTASVAACAAGMLCKESMVTAPIVIALFHSVYFAKNWRFFGALASTWALLLPSIVASTSISTGGFSSAQATPWTYLLNQTVIVTRYLRLAFWPSSLVNYYGWAPPLTLADVWMPAAFVAALVLASIVWLIKTPRTGFLAVSVFILLAPTSSIVPIAAEVGAERRMYLPLVCIVTLVVLGADAAWRRQSGSAAESPRRLKWFALAAGALAAVLAVVTIARNREYASALTMARTVLARWPTPMAHHLVGAELSFAGRRDEAIAELSIAARDYAPSRYYLGRELGAAGRFDEAAETLKAFVRDEPRAPVVPEVHGLIADALMRHDRATEAIPHFRLWLDANPSTAAGWTNFGRALALTGRPTDAAEAFARALKIDPNFAPARQGLKELGFER